MARSEDPMLALVSTLVTPVTIEFEHWQVAVTLKPRVRDAIRGIVL